MPNQPNRQCLFLRRSARQRMTTARPRLTRDADVARRATEKRVPSSETDLKRPPTTAGASRNTWRAARRPVRPLVEIAGSGVPPEAVRPALPQNGKRREEQRPPKGRRLPPNVSKASTYHERHSSSSWQTSPARRLRARPRSLTNPPNASSRSRTIAHHDTKSAPPSTQGGLDFGKRCRVPGAPCAASGRACRGRPRRRRSR